MRVVINGETLRKIDEIICENIALKKQVNDIKLEKVAKEVSNHIDTWMNEPHHGKSTKQDIDEFALKLTRYLDHRLKD